MESVRAYSHYLAMKGQLIGLTTIDGHRPTSEEKEVRNEICRACERMGRDLPSCTVGEIADYAGYYSMLYTIGYRKLPDPDLLEAQRDRLLRHWNAGDPSIEESDVYGMLLDSMRNPMSPVSFAARKSFNSLREDWLKTLKRFSSFPDSDAYERYRRLALILRDNVDSYFDGDSSAAKKTWFEKNHITDLSTVSTKILTAYRQFVCSLFPAVLSSDGMRNLDVAVLKELIGRRDLDEYDRKAYRLALAFETRKDA